MRQLPPARAVDIGTLTAGKLLVGGACLLMGWSFIESTGAASAEIDIFDGSATTGQIVAMISLTQGQSTRDLMTGSGIDIRTSLFVNAASGSIKGAVWVIPAEHLGPYEALVGPVPWYLQTE